MLILIMIVIGKEVSWVMISLLVVMLLVGKQVCRLLLLFLLHRSSIQFYFCACKEAIWFRGLYVLVLLLIFMNANKTIRILQAHRLPL
jgi:hypothetical protein